MYLSRDANKNLTLVAVYPADEDAVPPTGCVRCRVGRGWKEDTSPVKRGTCDNVTEANLWVHILKSNVSEILTHEVIRLRDPVIGNARLFSFCPFLS